MQSASGNQQTIKIKKNGFWAGIVKNIKAHPTLYLMALPVIIYYLIFQFWPMYGITIAFQRYIPAKGVFGSPWVGLDNFRRFFNDINFGRLLRNTFLMSFYDLIFGFPFPIIFALLLNEVRNTRYKKLTQTITYMPHFISLVVICGLIITFTKTSGPVAQIVAAIKGIPAENLLADPKYFRTLNISTNIWQGFGWGSIIYFAALSGVDATQYEAAVLDGAGRFQQMLYVTLPAIAPTIVIMLILRMGTIMSVGHEKIILLYSPITYETADVISTYVYRVGITLMDYSYGTAVGLFNSVINLALIILSNSISRRVNDTSLW